MDYGKAVEKMMMMDAASWERHANPWSVWTRVPILPLLSLAVYGRMWWGWWSAAFVAVLAIWAWLNPRVFPKPVNVDNWASKGVFGERIWLNRRNKPIPPHHARMAHVLSAAAASGIPVLIYGLIFLDAWATLAGVIIAAGAKLWFVDRMVWLFEDMKQLDPDQAGENHSG